MLLRCTCNAKLGELIGDVILVKHHQRVIVARSSGLLFLSCWRCGAMHDVAELLRHIEARHCGEADQADQ